MFSRIACEARSARSPHSAFRIPRSAFTLVELLVTIGIIVILIGILVPVVSSVRKSAKEADVKNQITVLAGAIQNYYNEFRAYPGPLSNREIADIDTPRVDNFAAADLEKITMSENLVLGLLGGLYYDSAADEVNFDWERVGQGPSYLRTPKKVSPYIDTTSLSWNRPGFTPGATSGKYADDIISTASVVEDTIIPEFVDRFSDPMPILYLRANVGAQSAGTTAANNPVITDGSNVGQYDITQYEAYVKTYTGGLAIGVGKDLNDSEYLNAPVGEHGLQDIDPSKTTADPYPMDAFPYFEHPTIPDTPREKDRFILISAGSDRVYGTKDDICSFGSVGQ